MNMEVSRLQRKATSLDDKYLSDSGSPYMTGIQALVRLALVQTRRDALGGIRSAGYISGYRGSPLGNFDTMLWQQGKQLANHRVVFRPAVNEDLAATALWGTQQANLAGQGKYDGVVGWWYGKGPESCLTAGGCARASRRRIRIGPEAKVKKRSSQGATSVCYGKQDCA